MNFQQGLSALNATSKNLEVIGNNIANSSTYGAKASRAEFADIYANSIGTTNNVGIGVKIETVAQTFTQGSIVSTNNLLDVAINGQGFFQVKDGSGSIMYSRNGQFKLDNEGYIVNNQSQRLLGYSSNEDGVIIPRSESELKLPTSGINPKETATATMALNLDSRGKVTVPASGNAIDYNDPQTYNNATSVTAYDKKGQPVALTFYFQKTATDTWDVFATADGISLATDGSGNPAKVTTLPFDPAGKAPTGAGASIDVLVPAVVKADGSSTEQIDVVKLDFSKATQYGSGFTVSDLTQDGYAPGQLSNLSIAENGVITARYTNGLTRAAGQIELSNFRNPQGLTAVGGNAWVQTYASGNPVGGVPGSGTLGNLQSGALEESNVDLTGELVNMIVAQRIYQANSQTIKTQDSILQTLVSLR